MQTYLSYHHTPTSTPTADGYSVELGHLEPHDQRGQILATGQFIRFMACVFAGAIQSFLLNGPSTNDQTGCRIAWDSCWSWGLTMAQVKPPANVES
jgi:hypothetical protein